MNILRYLALFSSMFLLAGCGLSGYGLTVWLHGEDYVGQANVTVPLGYQPRVAADADTSAVDRCSVYDNGSVNCYTDSSDSVTLRSQWWVEDATIAAVDFDSYNGISDTYKVNTFRVGTTKVCAAYTASDRTVSDCGTLTVK